MQTKTNFFSLIELLIVIAILGALATLMLPGFSTTEESSKQTIAMSEMREIQGAFRRFSMDVNLRYSEDRMADIATYGLWPLLHKDHPAGLEDEYAQYSDYDPETAKGRRGPYAQQQGTVTLDSNADIHDCQPSSDSGVSIPVIKDPWGNYYRVYVPQYSDCPCGETNCDGDCKEALLRMVLISAGPDGVVSSETISEIDSSGTSANRFDVKAKGDDIVIRLMPMATY